MCTLPIYVLIHVSSRYVSAAKILLRHNSEQILLVDPSNYTPICASAKEHVQIDTHF